MYPMQINVTIQNADQFAAFTAALAAGVNTAPAPAAKQTTKAETPKPEAKADTKSTPSTGTTKESPKSDAPSGTGASTGETGGKVYTLAEAKQMTTDAVKNGKRTEMVALLKEFGVAQTALLQPEQVQSFCEKAVAMLNEVAA